MSKLLTGSINLSKIKKDKLFTSEKTGNVFLNISVWVNDEKDQYGNIASVQQYLGKDAEKNYIGNLKELEQDVKPTVVNNEIPPPEEDDNLPF